jgi:ABC-type polar amino acid transport system ATPase subunit
LETFQQGEVQVGELKLSPSLPRAEASTTLRTLRRRVGMVFQQFHLFPHLSVIDNVMTGPRFVLGKSRAEAEPEARHLLDRVGLADKVDARPDQLSGGQQQRVAIARALAVHPEVVLFDEPTSALDPRMAGEVLAVIADLAKSGQTMIVVTHAMGFAQRVAHTVHLMELGKIAESGPPGQIFEAPTTEATKDFLARTKD